MPANQSVMGADGLRSGLQPLQQSVSVTVTGYPRSAADGTPVLLNGNRARLAGSVSMDMITVDVTDLDEVNIGDPVELWGKSLLLGEVAQYAGTISHELVTRVSVRVPRVPVG